MKPSLIFLSFVCFSMFVHAQGPATWDQNTAYTHPALVLNGSTTYISLQDVPSGTAITSTSYWTTLDSQVPSTTPTGAESLTTPDASEVSSLTVPTTGGADDPVLPGIGQVAIDDPNYAVPSYGTRIVNISTRGKVVGSSSDDALVGGFVMRGTPGAIKTVIVRGLGPYMS